MGEKLFRHFLDFVGEYKNNMFLIDVLDKLEKLELTNKSEDCIFFRKIRNQLAH